jgi:acyl transferase domain-containing protein/NADP-dependent 3-hydroxy acid dehydrogenase YdfG
VSTAPGPSQPPIAVVGVASLSPGAADAAEFWRTVLTGKDMIKDLPPTHWRAEDYYDADPAAPDRTYSRRGAFLDPVEFDSLAHGIPPATLPATDTTQLLALRVAEQVLADAGVLGGSAAGRERISVILGTAALELLQTMSNRMQRPVWLRALRASGIEERQASDICDRIAGSYVPWQEASFPGMLSNVVSGRIANRFDLHGTNYTTDAACASSLAALSGAISELALGRADMVLTGGVDTLNDILMYMCFSKTPALSKTGDCRPFSDQADGTMLGEALVMFALKRLDDAERDGDRVYAVIRGMGSSSDGRGSAIYAPVPEGQSRALRRAYAAAGYGPGTVDLVEAHGTATEAGDAAEFGALREVFEESGRADRNWCALGSVKSQIGHTKSAAGAAGLLKAVLSLVHKTLPPTIKVDRPNPALGLADSPFYLNTQPRPWVRPAAHPRRASVSSFGFGGTNFHLAVEEYVPTRGSAAREALRTEAWPTQLLLWNADSAAGLLDAARASLESGTEGARPLAELARRTQRSFDPTAPVRMCMVVKDVEELIAQVSRLGDSLGEGSSGAVATPDGAFLDRAPAASGKMALVFSGQGSQYVGMGADLAIHLPSAMAAWDRAAEVFGEDVPLHRVVFPAPVFSDEEREQQQALLTRTEWAQPALAVQSVAQLSVLRALGVEPDCVAGHSFGELVALHAAAAIDEQTLLHLAGVRGASMAEATRTPGAMLAADIGQAEAEEFLGGLAGQVWLANVNGPHQVVFSGQTEGIARLAGELGERGVTARRLQASAAFHTPLLGEARRRFGDELARSAFATPAIAVYGNADADRYPEEPDRVRQRLADQLLAPVRFADEVTAMYDAGVRTFVEVGAGGVLSRLIGDTLGDRPHQVLSLDRRGVHGVTALQRGLGRLAVAGVALDFEPLWQQYHRPAAGEGETRRSATTVRISGANFGKPEETAGTGRTTPAPGRIEPRATPPAPAVMVPPTAVPPSPVPSDPVPPGSVPAGTDVAGTTAFEVTQQHAAEAHAEFQRVMTESHLAYLRMAENSWRAFAGSPVEEPVNAAETPTAFTAPSALPGSLPGAAPSSSPVVVPPPQEAAAGPVEPAGDTGPGDVGESLLQVVAERTGYPLEVLEPHLELEGDLGVDSIKRVQILSLLRKRFPGVPEIGTGELGRLRTLGQIIARLGGEAPPETAEPSVPPVPGPAVAETPPDPRVIRTVTTTRPARAPRLELPGLRRGTVTIVDGGSGLAGLLVQQLGSRGIDARAAAGADADTATLVLLNGMREVASASDAVAVNHEVFAAARQAASRFALGDRTLVVVQDTGGDFGLSGAGTRAWLGGLAGLVRCAAREWPGSLAKVVDCARGNRSPEKLSGVLLDELLLGGATSDIGLPADGTRWTLVDEPALAGPPPEDVVQSPAVVVATGGARGVTAAALKALAGTPGTTFVLLGRTELAEEPPDLADVVREADLRRRIASLPVPAGRAPRSAAEIGAEARRIVAAREIRATLAALAATGAAARYLTVDVRDETAVRAALDRVRAEFGPVTGLIHGAGVLADALLADKTDEQFSAVFDTKVLGLRNLLAATEADPLRLLSVFSSVAGRFGNTGQSDYAMANEILAQVASQEAAGRPRCVVRSIAWGPWDGGMVGPQLRAHFAENGVPLLPEAVGAAELVRELAAGANPARVTIAAGDRVDPFGEHTGPMPVGTVFLDTEAHPYLVDHVVDATPILPMALVVEWFHGAAGALLPGSEDLALHDFEVVRGVPLPDLAGDGHRLSITAAAAGGAWRLALTDPAGEVCYQASATGGGGRVPRRDWAVPPGDTRFGDRARYDGRLLFHGPAFQTLGEPGWVSESGATAPLVGVRKGGGWPQEGWHTDPGAVDAGLQLALVWAARASDAEYLPVAIGEVRIHRPHPLEVPARGVVAVVEKDPYRPVCDVAVVDGDGTVLVELLGTALARRPEPRT